MYFQTVKTSKAFAARKAAPRRFVPGHTAFKTMSHLPVLTRDAMQTVTADERERVFRGVTGTDKYTPGVRNATETAGDAEPDDDDDVVEVQDDADCAAPLSGEQTVLFWMELHPKAPAPAHQPASARPPTHAPTRPPTHPSRPTTHPPVHPHTRTNPPTHRATDRRTLPPTHPPTHPPSNPPNNTPGGVHCVPPPP